MQYTDLEGGAVHLPVALHEPQAQQARQARGGGRELHLDGLAAAVQEEGGEEGNPGDRIRGSNQVVERIRRTSYIPS